MKVRKFCVIASFAIKNCRLAQLAESSGKSRKAEAPVPSFFAPLRLATIDANGHQSIEMSGKSPNISATGPFFGQGSCPQRRRHVKDAIIAAMHSSN
jgi:hypothetical protein